MQLQYNGNFENLASMQEKYEDSFINIAGFSGMMTPDIDESYWLFRVALTENQAIVAFPKFGTFGIGFQVEKKDWNTNPPYTCDTEEIYNHIKINKGDKAITKKMCIDAIQTLQLKLREFNPE
jgi:hypothetical protein